MDWNGLSDFTILLVESEASTLFIMVTPAHGRLAPMATYLHHLLKKYGVQPGKAA